MKQQECIDGLTGVVVVADDIMVFGEGDTEAEALENRKKESGCIAESGSRGWNAFQ